MIHVLDGQDFADVAAFVDALNKARLANKGKWIAYVGTVAGQSVRIKSYGTGYLQIFDVNGRHQPTGMDMNVSAWRGALTHGIQRYVDAAA